MAPDGGGGTSGQVLKKGPWTAAEDAILMEYVKKKGEGNWNAVQKNSGLMRCGKSCRLRWANHLRPNLKKGVFTVEEERLIIELHAKLGNKWARMAAQLPGRTDNEIKNYWNTRIKRRQRAGLPIYPQDIKHHHLPNSSSSSLSALLSSPPPSHRHKPISNPSLSLFDSINYPHHDHNSSSFPDPHHHFKLFRNNNCGLAVSPFFNQGLPNELVFPKSSAQFDSLNFNINPIPVMGVPIPLIDQRMKTELPSIQSPVLEPTPTSSGTVSSDVDEYENGPEYPRGNCGLLEDLLEESQALIRAEKSKKEKLLTEDIGNGKCIPEYGAMENDSDAGPVESVFKIGYSQANPENHWEDSISAYSSTGMKAKKDVIEEMNIMDEDLLSLLNFPSTVPLPDWYGGSGNASNGQSLNMADGNVGMENQREASHSPVVTTSAMANHDWTLGSCCWNNMPGIY